MKKYLVLLLTISLVFWTSCSTEPNEPTTPTPVEVIDAAAAMEALATFGEFAYVNPWVAVGVAVTVAVLAADASGGFGRSVLATNTYGKASLIDLPANYVLANNPFEELSQYHNRSLNFLNRRSDFLELRDKLSQYDQSAWNEMINEISPNISNTQKIEIVEIARNYNFFNRFASLGLYDKNISFEVLCDRLSISEESKDYLKAFFSDCKALSENGKTFEEIMVYYNDEISRNLRPDNQYTVEKASVITFLTTAKHSRYYWSTN